MAERYFCANLPRSGPIRLEGDEARHLATVCRLSQGSVVEVFDGAGLAIPARVIAVGKNRVDLEAAGDGLPDRVAFCRLTLAAAVPKGERFDWLVEKATELGVERLVPIVTERSVVDPRRGKLERLKRLIVEASKQCRRNRLMELSAPASWSEWLSEATNDAPRLLAHPGGEPPAAWCLPRRGGPATLAIGPEGGFTETEVEAARRAGWRLIGLGATVLRTETAALAGCAMILALCEGCDR